MKFKKIIYLLSEDTDEGHTITAYPSKEAMDERRKELVRTIFTTDMIWVKVNQGEDLESMWSEFCEASSERNDYYGTDEQELEIEVPGRFAVATVKAPNYRGRMFAEEFRVDNGRPYNQAWAIDSEDAKALHPEQEIVIRIPDESSEYCQIVSPQLP